MLEEGSPNPHGEAMVNELAYIHGIIRENLAAIRAVTDMVVTGVAPEDLQAELKQLSATNIIWTLRTGCLRYCHLVHSHHGGEDAHFFPGLRRLNPVLRPVIDKLEADHLAIARYLDSVEAAAKLIATDDAARSELADALNALSEHLIVHLDYEEENLNPTLRRLTGWPFM